MSISQEATQLRLDANSNGMVLAPAEFDKITDYDEAFCYELIHGVVVVNPIPAEAESDPNEELGYLLRQYKANHKRGSAFDKTLAERYVHSADGRRRADRVIWTGLGRLPDPKRDPPSIVVEFVSAAKRDRHRDYVEKRREYLALAVIEYWIIDRFERTMTVCRSDQPDEVITPAQTYTTELLPGFELRLERLFQVADQWNEQPRSGNEGSD